MSEKKYGILYQDGRFEKTTGNNIQEIFAKKGNKTLTGEIDFSSLETYEILPSAVLMNNEYENQYMVFLMRDKKSRWEPIEKVFNIFTSESGLGAEDIMKLKVKLEGFFSGLVVDMKNEKPISWIWSR